MRVGRFAVFALLVGGWCPVGGQVVGPVPSGYSPRVVASAPVVPAAPVAPVTPVVPVDSRERRGGDGWQVGEVDLPRVGEGVGGAVFSDVRRFSTLSLGECQDVARQLNRGRRQLENVLRSAVEGREIAEAEVYAPRLSFSQSLSDQNDDGELRAELRYLAPQGIEVEPFVSERSRSGRDERWGSDVGITLRRQLFAAKERWRLRQPITEAERALLQAQNRLQLQDRQLDFLVLQSFLGVQRVENRLRVRRNRVKDARAFLRVTEERVESGLAPRVDIVNARISLNQAEADVLNEEDNLLGQTERLLNVLGLPVTEGLGIVPYDLEEEVGRFDLAGDMAAVRDRHESLVNVMLDLDFARHGIEIAEDRLRPDVGLALTAGRRADGPLLNDRLDDSDSVSLALTFELPLDGKRREKARLRQLELARENLELDLVDAERGLQLELRSAHRGIGRLKTQVGLAKQLLEAERAKLRATLVRYEDGNVDNLEVTRAKQAVDNAEIGLMNTKLDLVLAAEEYRSILPPAGIPQKSFSAP